MLPIIRALLLAAGLLAATSLAYPTWWLGAYNFRCKPPYYVESFTNDWGEWRVSSVCAPGTCCSNWANTGTSREYTHSPFPTTMRRKPR